METLYIIAVILLFIVVIMLLSKSKKSGFVGPEWSKDMFLNEPAITEENSTISTETVEKNIMEQQIHVATGKGERAYPIIGISTLSILIIGAITLSVVLDIFGSLDLIFLPFLGIIGLILVLVVPSLYYIKPLNFSMVEQFIPLDSKDDEQDSERVRTVAPKGQAGYQSKLIDNGLRLIWWFLKRPTLWSYGSIPQDELGIVIFQIGKERPSGQKTADVKIRDDDDDASGDLPSLREVIADPELYIKQGGESGPSRYILKPGDPFVYHPAACLIILKDQVLGMPISAEARALVGSDGKPNLKKLGLKPEDFEILKIQPGPGKYVDVDGDLKYSENLDMCGVVTILDGPPPPSGTIASRVGGWRDLDPQESAKDADGREYTDEKRRDRVLRGSDEFKETHGYQRLGKLFSWKSDNGRWLNYAGLQVDTLVEGNYLLNPLLVRVRLVPQLNVREGWVAGIISNVGLAEEDISGSEFEHGTIVKWGYRGIQNLSLSPRKYALNPSCFTAVLFRTALTTLELIDEAGELFDHGLDNNFMDVTLTTKDGYQPKLGVIIQFYISDKNVAQAMQRYSNMKGLVDQAIIPIVTTQLGIAARKRTLGEFIEQTNEIIDEALDGSKDGSGKDLQVGAKQQLNKYYVNLVKIAFGPRIKNIPEAFEEMRTGQTLAIEREKKYNLDTKAETTRIKLESARGTADASHEIKFAKGMIVAQANWSEAIKKLSEGIEVYKQRAGEPAANELGKDLAVAMAMLQQKTSIGEKATALLNVVKKLSDAGIDIVPRNLVISGDGAGMLNSLLGQLSGFMQNSLPEDLSQGNKRLNQAKEVKQETKSEKKSE